MIQKTPAEKAALKEAKAKYNAAVRTDKFERVMMQEKEKRKNLHTFLKTGILETERLLPDDYPVNWDFMYIIDDNGGKVVRSGIMGTVATLKRDLRRLGHKALNIYTCDYLKRTTMP